MSETAPPSTPGGSRSESTTPAPRNDSPAAPLDVLPTPADLFPGFEIVAEISRGGQGIVYQAVQLATKRKVAIKVLLHGHYADSDSRRRFQREIELLAQLRHPHIVSIFHADLTRDGRQFYVMDYVRGLRLDEYLRDQDASIDRIVRLALTVCEAVSYAHAQGIVHRDLKPQNILVDRDGQPHILDFGLARTLSENVDQQVSLTRAVIGTLRYLAPEQAAGDPAAIDARTDIYALGIILFTILTGCMPYDTDGSWAEAIHNISHTRPPRPSSIRQGTNPDLDTIILKCLAKERERRYPSAAALADDLRACLAGSPISAKQDSVIYLLRRHARQGIARHLITAHLAVIAAATVLAIGIGERLFFSWTRAGLALDRVWTNQMAPTPAAAALQQVRVIALTDETDIAALAEQESLPGVSLSNRRSLRRLHGRLMERLARAGARAVAFDITFEGETPFDADFARGADALHDAGAEVMVNVTEWPLQGLSKARLSRTIAPHVRWGRPVAGLTSQSPWHLVLFMQRGLAEPLPSLVLTTLAACRHPDAEPAYRIDDANEAVEILYYKAEQGVPRSKILLGPSDHVDLTYLKSAPADTPAMGLMAGDRVGYFVVPMPDSDVLASATIEYNTIFSTPPETLDDLLRGKVVVIGDLHGKTDRYVHPDGRTLPGCYAHAVGIDMLLRSMSVEHPDAAARWTLTACGGLLGCVIAALTSRRRGRTYLLFAAVAAVSGATSLALVRWAGMVWIPLVPILAMIIAGELSLRMHMRNGPDRRTTW